MTAVTVTDAMVRSAVLSDGKAEAYLRDKLQPGLAVRLRAGGGKTFVYFCTRPGRKGTHHIAIGPCKKLTVAIARKHAAILAGQRAQGIDLVAAKRAAREEARKAAKRATLGALVAQDGPYETSLKRRGVVKAKPALSALRRNLPLATDVASLTRLDITSAIGKLVEAGKPGAALDLRRHTNTFLNWAQAEGHVTHNVLAGFRRPKQTRPQRLAQDGKRRALSDKEIGAFWTAAGGLGVFGLLARMCLLGGARRSEPAVIEWRHVLNDRIVFDPETTKMGRAHAVPRTPLIDEVLAAAKGFRQASSALVFPGKRGSPFGGFTKSVAKLIERAGVAKFTLHDLRRTLRTIMSRCGYDNEIQRLCVGQKSHGIDAVYNLDEQWQIRKMAFEAAHAYITAVIRGCSTDSVVWMQRASNPQNRFKAQLLERLRERCE